MQVQINGTANPCFVASVLEEMHDNSSDYSANEMAEQQQIAKNAAATGYGGEYMNFLCFLQLMQMCESAGVDTVRPILCLPAG